MRWSALALLILLAVPGPCLAQDTADPKAWAEKFFSRMVTEGAEKAFRLLEATSFAAKSDAATLKGIGDTMIKTGSAFGAAIGYEAAGEKKIGGSILLLVYVVKYEQSAIVWELDFYKPRERWDLHRFRFYDNLAKLPHF
jgi:hypothetical protein